MKEGNPLSRLRLRQPKELTLHVLKRVLCQLRPNEEPFVRHRRQGTMVIRTVTSACPGVAIDGAVLQVGGYRAVNAGSVHPVIARQLPARGGTSSSLGIGTSPRAELSLRDGTL
jgi:hypothetical protein